MCPPWTPRNASRAPVVDIILDLIEIVLNNSFIIKSYFVLRSVTMDKWKESEVMKMKVGGNRKAKDFLEDHTDWNSSAPISQKYNSRAAALYKDKVNIDGLKVQYFINGRATAKYLTFKSRKFLTNAFRNEMEKHRL